MAALQQLLSAANGVIAGALAGEQTSMAIAAGATLVAGAALSALLTPARVKPSTSKVVVISGCDTGFGHMLALQLSAAGFTVFAGCLTKEGAANLTGLSKGHRGPLHALPLDVTREADIAAFSAAVGAATPRIHALVNNAGIGASGLVDMMPMEDYRRIMEVNFFGHVAMTKALLGLLCAADPADGRRGRVINVASVAGIIAAPGLSAYSASKFALEAFSDSLRREMAVWRLPVVLIEPSFLRTAIIEGAGARLEAQWRQAPEEVRRRWGEEYFQTRILRARSVQDEAESPQLAVDAMIEGITSPSPPARIKAGLRAKWLYGPLSLAPAWLLDALMVVVAGSSTVPAGARA